MNILLIYPRDTPSQAQRYQYIFSLGLPYILATLKMHGFRVYGLNLNHSTKCLARTVREAIRRHGVDVVCTGGISGSYRAIRDIVAEVRREAGGIKVILGGGIVSADPNFMLTSLQPDYIVRGEGEVTIVELIEALSTGRATASIPGIGFLDETGKPRLTEQRTPVEDLDLLPWPDLEAFGYEEYLSCHRAGMPAVYTDYFSDPRPYPITGSRSCPFPCTFCFNTVNGPYRQRSIGSILSELEYAIPKYRVNLVLFYDDLFACETERVIELCAGMRRLRSTLDWDMVWNCSLRVRPLRKDVLSLLAESGCFMVSFGLESYSREILTSMRKGTTPPQVSAAIDAAVAAGLQVDGNFILGDPKETTETARETIDYWASVQQYGINLDIIKPYPGCSLHNIAVRRGAIPDRQRYYLHQYDEPINLTAMDNRRYRSMVTEVYRSKIRGRTYTHPRTARYRGRALNILADCPHCGESVALKGYVVRSRFFYSLPKTCTVCNRCFSVIPRTYRYLTWLLARLASLLPGKVRNRMLSRFLPV